MPIINVPMKPCTYDPARARFPYLVTPKIDGIRFIVGPNEILSCSMKPIPNRDIQALHPKLFVGMEGELFHTNFNTTTSLVMSYDKPATNVILYVFDFIDPNCPIQPYNKRIGEMKAVCRIADRTLVPDQLCPVLPLLVNNTSELDSYITQALAAGWEGVILRAPLGKYKQGRSTLNDQYLLRIKPYEDDEAVVIDVEPKFRNDNESLPDERGLLKKSSHAENKVALPLLGALVLKHPKFGQFNCGSGFTEEQRLAFWQKPPIGLLAKFKYQAHGTKDKPRTPIFLGFRHEDDCNSL